MTRLHFIWATLWSCKPILPDGRLKAGPDQIVNIVEQASLGRDADPVRRLAVLDNDFLEFIRESCGIPSDQPLVADWAIGSAGTRSPVQIEIAAAIVGTPPLYPNAPDLLVFEHDYQAAMNLLNVSALDSLRIATAYFPIEGFAAAGQVLREAGYRIRDDSKAAVQTLQQVQTAASVIPATIVWLNLIGGALVIVLFVDSLVDLNKRVLAIFVAHGFRYVDLLSVLVRHMLPALAFAVITLIVGVAIVFAGSFISATVVVFFWWRRIRLNLKSYLQE